MTAWKRVSWVCALWLLSACYTVELVVQPPDAVR